MNQPLTSEELELFHESLDRTLGNEQFLSHFYESFLTESDEIAAYFKNSDMKKLTRKLSTTLRLITLAIDKSPGADQYLEYLGKFHHDIKVPKSLYDNWLNSLLHSVQHADPEFDTELHGIWNKAISIGIQEMHKAYQ